MKILSLEPLLVLQNMQLCVCVCVCVYVYVSVRVCVCVCVHAYVCIYSPPAPGHAALRERVRVCVYDTIQMHHQVTQHGVQTIPKTTASTHTRTHAHTHTHIHTRLKCTFGSRSKACKRATSMPAVRSLARSKAMSHARNARCCGAEVCVCVSVKRGLPYGKRDLLNAQKRPTNVLAYLRYA